MTFTVNLAQIWLSALALNIGRPFRAPLWRNRTLVSVLTVQLAIVLYCVFTPVDYPGGRHDPVSECMLRWSVGWLVALLLACVASLVQLEYLGIKVTKTKQASTSTRPHHPPATTPAPPPGSDRVFPAGGPPPRVQVEAVCPAGGKRRGRAALPAPDPGRPAAFRGRVVGAVQAGGATVNAGGWWAGLESFRGAQEKGGRATSTAVGIRLLPWLPFILQMCPYPLVFCTPDCKVGKEGAETCIASFNHDNRGGYRTLHPLIQFTPY